MVWSYAQKLTEESQSSGQEARCFWVSLEAWPTDSSAHEDDQMAHLHFCKGGLDASFMYRFSLWVVTLTEQPDLTSELSQLGSGIGLPPS